jgi:hypothetical protein
MFESLETYLQEIGRYLPVKGGGNEIIAEIRSHILEKAERGPGGATEESVREVIASYGRPQDVAAQYVEGNGIIAPVFRRHLFRYTWILFAVHTALTAIAIWFHASILMFPFFFIPRMHAWTALVYLPMAWLADFGLVAFTLFVVTQRNGSPSLPWLRIFRSSPMRQPRPRVLVTLLVVLVVFVALFIRYRTIFFYSANLRPFESLMDPTASMVISIMFIAAILCHVVAYAVRFVVNSAWVQLAKNTIILLILWSIWNVPVTVRFKEVPGIDLRILGGVFVIVLIANRAVHLIRSLFLVAREMSK